MLGLNYWYGDIKSTHMLHKNSKQIFTSNSLKVKKIAGGTNHPMNNSLTAYTTKVVLPHEFNVQTCPD
jgi:hypothetical protein